MRTLFLSAVWLLLVLVSCKPADIIFAHEGKVNLDTTYRFYVRNVFRTTDASGQKSTKSNVEGASKQDLIEIQYMLVSSAHRSVIYMSMKPDLWGKHYQYYSSTTLNLDDVDKIQFGRIYPDGTYRFFSKDGYSSTSWQVDADKNKVRIERIQYWLGEYGSDFMTSGIDNQEQPWEFLESEINVTQALFEEVEFVRTKMNCIGMDGLSFDIPAKSHFGFRQRAGRKHRITVEYEVLPKYVKTYSSGHIKSTPIPLMKP